jgi:hypothetical protein
LSHSLSNLVWIGSGLGLTSDQDPPIYVSWVAKIIDALYHVWLIYWDRVSLSFCPGWPQITILQIFTYQVQFFFFLISVN